MSIRPGADWGDSAPPPPDLDVFTSDTTAAARVADARRANRPVPPIGLSGGDLHRTLGGTPGRDPRQADAATRVRIDLGACLIDGALHWFLAHVTVRQRGWHGPWLIAANAAFLGPWNVAPRAHPGDGRLDILEGSLSLGDRLKARRRVVAGTHVPHPNITARRAAHFQREFERPQPIRLDGHIVGRASTLSIRLESDAVEVWL